MDILDFVRKLDQTPQPPAPQSEVRQAPAQPTPEAAQPEDD